MTPSFCHPVVIASMGHCPVVIAGMGHRLDGALATERSDRSIRHYHLERLLGACPRIDSKEPFCYLIQEAYDLINLEKVKKQISFATINLY